MLRNVIRNATAILSNPIVFLDGTRYRRVNAQGTLVRDPRKLRGKARVKAAKRVRVR